MKRITGLDGLRGVAIISVLLYHTCRLQSSTPASENANNFLQSLWLGVDLFFVLSGFLITRILLQLPPNKSSVVSFYGRRILRIFPLYYGTLLVILGLGISGIPIFIEVKEDFIHHLTYTFNFNAYLNGWNKYQTLDHFWSLCIEEQFYLIWPFIILYTPRKFLPIILYSFIFGGIILRILLSHLGYNWIVLYTFPLARMDGLAMGGLLALYLLNKNSSRELVIRYAGLASFTTLIILYLNWGTFKVTDHLTLVLVPSLFAISVLPLFVILDTNKNHYLTIIFSNKVLVFIGKISYGMYVFHQIVWVLFKEYFGLKASPVSFLVVLSTTVMISIASFYFFEAYFLSQKFKFKYTSSP